MAAADRSEACTLDRRPLHGEAPDRGEPLRHSERQHRYRPIGDYALLSDGRGSALVSAGGSVDWCCVQRFDARPVFTRLLDHDRGGFFRIALAADTEVQRRYLPGTLILETTFETATGRLRLTDFMAMYRDSPDGEGPSGTQRPGAEDRLVRIVTCEQGRVETKVEFVPRFDYGVTIPQIDPPTRAGTGTPWSGARSC